MEAVNTLSLNDAAARLAISPRHLARQIASGALPSLKIGRRRLIRVADLRQWLDAKVTR